jgi:tetratricopeptide (TPR) repeat protein
VLKTDPGRIDALIYRASAYRGLGRLAPALADVDKALTLAPDSVPALLERGNIRRLGGDNDGARQDWARVAELAPGSAAEAAAKKNIERLAAPGGATQAKPGSAR